MARVVIIGASIAGHSVAVSLREKNSQCFITLITEEPYPLCDRRRLVDYLRGSLAEKDILLSSEDFYREKNIVFLKEKEAIALNPEKRKISLKNSESLEYDFLVICSGKSFILPTTPGIKKSGVFRLYSWADFKDFFANLISEPVCLAGSNDWVINIAKIIASKQKEVKLISRNSLQSTESGLAGNTNLSPKIEIINSEIVEIIGEGEVQAIRLKEGKIIGTSIIAFMEEYKSNIDFLKDTGIELSWDAISVDEQMRTNLKNIYACGAVCASKGEGLKIKPWDKVINESYGLIDHLASAIGQNFSS